MKVQTILSKGKQSYWIRSGMLTFLNRMSGSLFGFFSFFLLLRMLPQHEYGIWMLFISVTTVIELIKVGFIRNPMIKYYQEAQDNSRVVSSSLLLNVLITLLISLLLVVSAESLSAFWNQPLLQELFLIFIITLLLMVPLNHFDYIQQANLSFKGSLYSEITRQCSFFVCVLIYFVFSLPLELTTLACFQAISIGLSALMSFILGRKYQPAAFNPSMFWLGRLFSFGKYTFGTSVSSMLMRNTDTWMLGRMMSPLAVAIYNPALRIANLLEIPALTLASILFPKLTKQIAEEGQQSARYLYEKSVGAILCCVLPVVLGVLLLAEPITVLIAGRDYIAAAPVLQITVIYCCLLPFNRQFGVTLDAMGKPGINFLFVLRDALLNIGLNYYFISRYGVIGAAYGTATTYLIALIINQIYLHRQLKVSFIQIFMHTFSLYRQIGRSGFAMLKNR